jgi:spore coat polysaccharide biosynthesis protein SpsF (cytidylyltransferase family)
VIQARLGSSRFPNKIAADLCGKSVLQWVVDQASLAYRTVRVLAPHGDSGVIAACLDKQDGERICDTFDGIPADDVLLRFAAFTHCNFIRICGDNPLVWPGGIRRLIEVARWVDCDYIGYRFADGTPAITRPTGYFAEYVSSDAIRRALRMTRWNDPRREHVTQIMYENPDIFHCEWLEVPDWYDGSNAAIDTPEDLERVRKMIEEGRVPWSV